MNITDLSDDKLKAIIYDSQINIRGCERELARRAQIQVQSKEEKKDKDEKK